MAANMRGPRDPITSKGPATGSPSRSDLLNGQPRTKSLGSKPPNFTKKDDPRSSFPVPNSPYSGGE